MQTRLLAGKAVSRVGLGCMNLSHAYGAPLSFEEGERVLLAALDAGVTHFDTATLYGFGSNETLLGKVLRPHRNAIFLASKCGMSGVDKNGDGKLVRVIDGRPQTLKQQIDASLKRLQTDYLDLYYLHRWDKSVPIEDSVGALADMVRAGKIGAIGLSEVGSSTLRKAHAVAPIAALQTEYSLWTRNPEISVLQTCADLGVAFVAFSPVGRGFFGNVLTDVSSLHLSDIRRHMPRFNPDNYPRNLALLKPLNAIAQDYQATAAQIAQAWVLAQGAKHHAAANQVANESTASSRGQTTGTLPMHSIPGTTSVAHLRENLASDAVVLSDETLEQLDQLFPPQAIYGERYNAQGSSEVDTENF